MSSNYNTGIFPENKEEVPKENENLKSSASDKGIIDKALDIYIPFKMNYYKETYFSEEPAPKTDHKELRVSSGTTINENESTLNNNQEVSQRTVEEEIPLSNRNTSVLATYRLGYVAPTKNYKRILNNIKRNLIFGYLSTVLTPDEIKTVQNRVYSRENPSDNNQIIPPYFHEFYDNVISIEDAYSSVENVIKRYMYLPDKSESENQDNEGTIQMPHEQFGSLPKPPELESEIPDNISESSNLVIDNQEEVSETFVPTSSNELEKEVVELQETPLNYCKPKKRLAIQCPEHLDQCPHDIENAQTSNNTNQDKSGLTNSDLMRNEFENVELTEMQLPYSNVQEYQNLNYYREPENNRIRTTRNLNMYPQKKNARTPTPYPRLRSYLQQNGAFDQPNLNNCNHTMISSDPNNTPRRKNAGRRITKTNTQHYMISPNGDHLIPTPNISMTPQQDNILPEHMYHQNNIGRGTSSSFSRLQQDTIAVHPYPSGMITQKKNTGRRVTTSGNNLGHTSSGYHDYFINCPQEIPNSGMFSEQDYIMLENNNLNNPYSQIRSPLQHDHQSLTNGNYFRYPEPNLNKKKAVKRNTTDPRFRGKLQYENVSQYQDYSEENLSRQTPTSTTRNPYFRMRPYLEDDLVPEDVRLRNNLVDDSQNYFITYPEETNLFETPNTSISSEDDNIIPENLTPYSRLRSYLQQGSASQYSNLNMTKRSGLVPKKRGRISLLRNNLEQDGLSDMRQTPSTSMNYGQDDNVRRVAPYFRFKSNLQQNTISDQSNLNNYHDPNYTMRTSYPNMISETPRNLKRLSQKMNVGERNYLEQNHLRQTPDSTMSPRQDIMLEQSNNVTPTSYSRLRSYLQQDAASDNQNFNGQPVDFTRTLYPNMVSEQNGNNMTKPRNLKKKRITTSDLQRDNVPEYQNYLISYAEENNIPVDYSGVNSENQNKMTNAVNLLPDTLTARNPHVATVSSTITHEQNNYPMLPPPAYPGASNETDPCQFIVPENRNRTVKRKYKSAKKTGQICLPPPYPETSDIRLISMDT